MIDLTRLDCLLGSAAEIRRAFIEALHHARHRRAFGKRLVDQPLMREVLVDLALESEIATRLAFRVAAAIDRSESDPHEAAFARVATAIGKYWVCHRAPSVVNEAQECFGGAGYVEESILARLYREAPLNRELRHDMASHQDDEARQARGALDDRTHCSPSSGRPLAPGRTRQPFRCLLPEPS